MYRQLDADLIALAKTRVLGGVWVGNTPPDRVKHLGDYAEDVTIDYEVEESEVEWNNTKTRELARTDVTKKTGTVNLSLRQLTEFAKEAMYMATKTAYTQAAAVDVEKEFENLEVGDILETGYRNLSEATIVDGAVEYVSPTHLWIDKATGRIEIIALPVGASGDGTLTFSAPAILEAAKVSQFNVLKGEGITMRLVFRQINEGGDDLVLPKVQLRADGSITLGTTGDEYSSLTLVGKILSDTSLPEEFSMGYAVPITEAA